MSGVTKESHIYQHMGIKILNALILPAKNIFYYRPCTYNLPIENKHIINTLGGASKKELNKQVWKYMQYNSNFHVYLFF